MNDSINQTTVYQNDDPDLLINNNVQVVEGGEGTRVECRRRQKRGFSKPAQRTALRFILTYTYNE